MATMSAAATSILTCMAPPAAPLGSTPTTRPHMAFTRITPALHQQGQHGRIGSPLIIPWPLHIPLLDCSRTTASLKAAQLRETAAGGRACCYHWRQQLSERSTQAVLDSIRGVNSSRLNTSSSDGPPSGRPSSAPWHSGSTSAASPPSALLRPAAPSILRHHTADRNNDCAASIAGSAVGGKRRGEAIMIPVDRHQQDCAQQQRQPSQDWRSRTCAAAATSNRLEAPGL